MARNSPPTFSLVPLPHGASSSGCRRSRLGRLPSLSGRWTPVATTSHRPRTPERQGDAAVPPVPEGAMTPVAAVRPLPRRSIYRGRGVVKRDAEAGRERAASRTPSTLRERRRDGAILGQMRRLRAEIDVAAPPDRVWEVHTTFAIRSRSSLDVRVLVLARDLRPVGPRAALPRASLSPPTPGVWLGLLVESEPLADLRHEASHGGNSTPFASEGEGGSRPLRKPPSSSLPKGKVRQASASQVALKTPLARRLGASEAGHTLSRP